MIQVQMTKGQEFDVLAAPDGVIAGPVLFTTDRDDVVDVVALTDLTATVKAKADGVEGVPVVIIASAKTPSGKDIFGDQTVEVTLIPKVPVEATVLVVTTTPVRDSV